MSKQNTSRRKFDAPTAAIKFSTSHELFQPKSKQNKDTMTPSQPSEQDIAQLQLLEQNLQSYAMQRQNFQMQLGEIENALTELKNSKEKPYKIIGNIMVSTPKEALVKDLESKKEILDLRIKTLEKQESKLRETAEELQQKLLAHIQEKGGK